MSLIEKLVAKRLDNFIKEYDIDINCFGINILNNRKVSWQQLKQKFIKDNLVADCCDACDCYLIIKNNIWKNIITYNIINNEWHIYRHHNNTHDTSPVFRQYCPYLSYDTLLNKISNTSVQSNDNCTKLETKIINYIMLLNIIVRQYMISDLVDICKIYIFDVILIL